MTISPHQLSKIFASNNINAKYYLIEKEFTFFPSAPMECFNIPLDFFRANPLTMRTSATFSAFVISCGAFEFWVYNDGCYSLEWDGGDIEYVISVYPNHDRHGGYTCTVGDTDFLHNSIQTEFILDLIDIIVKCHKGLY